MISQLFLFPTFPLLLISSPLFFSSLLSNLSVSPLFSPPPVLDSSGRIPPGLMTGTLTSLGDYDQCLRIEVKEGANEKEENVQDEEVGNEGVEIRSSKGEEETKDDDEREGRSKRSFLMRSQEVENVVRGQYCLLRTRPVLPLPDQSISLKDIVINVTGTILEPTIYKDIAAVAHGFYSIPIQFALCIPSTCNPKEIEVVIQQLLHPIHFSATLGPVCDVKSSKVQMDKAQFFSIIVVSTIIFIILLFTLIDCLLQSCCPNIDLSSDHVKKNFFFILTDSFSMVKNSSKLFNLETESEPKLHFIHGMRVLTMIWVIVCHTYTFGTQFLTAIGSVRIEHEIRPLSRTLSMQFVLNGWFSVETFFFLR